MASSAAPAVAKAAAYSLRLIYMPVRARAEAARMLLHYNEIEFKDEIVSRDDLAALRASSPAKLPFGKVPVLYINETTAVAQSGSICRFIAKLANMMPADPVKAALIDQVHEQSMDMSAINPILNIFEGDLETQKWAAYEPTLPPRLEQLSRMLGDHDWFGLEQGLSYADFSMFSVLDNVMTFTKGEYLKAYPKLLAWHARFAALPRVKEYLASRPAVKKYPRKKKA